MSREADQPASAGGDPGRGRRLHVPRHADSPARLQSSGTESAQLIVDRVSLVNFRSYAKLELDLRPGLVLAVGPNGVGKTNLLEALHVGTQGFSPRTRNDAQTHPLRRRGDPRGGSRVIAATVAELEVELVVEAGVGKRAKANGAPLHATEQLRSETTTLVFTPDRLGVVKGAPAARRAYFDRVARALRRRPARSSRRTTAPRCRRRNASLRRVAAGTRLATRLRRGPNAGGRARDGARRCATRDAAAARAALRRARAAELGLSEGELRYDGDPPTARGARGACSTATSSAA